MYSESDDVEPPFDEPLLDDDEPFLTPSEAIGSLTLVSENLRSNDEWQDQEKRSAAAKWIDESRYTLYYHKLEGKKNSEFTVVTFINDKLKRDEEQ